MVPWEPGIPLYEDPDIRYDRGERDLQYAREMWELIEEPWEIVDDPDDLWMHESRASRWWGGQTSHTWSWQAPIVKRRVKSGKRR